MNFSNKLIEKAKTASSVEELLEIAKKEGIELSVADAEMYFGFLTKGSQPLTDDELEQVAGGKGGGPKPLYKAGQRVQYLDPYGVVHYGTIESSLWVELQKAFYYLVLMDEGEKMEFPLEADICPATVIS